MVKACARYKDFNAVCIREIQKSLKFSAKKLIEDKIKEAGLQDHFIITQNEIKSASGGIIIFQGMQDHTAESIKSLEGFDVAWVEEAQSISHRSLELLLPTIRADHSEIWFSWNPTYEDDPVELLFDGLDESNSTLVKSNYTQNTELSDTLKEEAERHKKINPDTFDHVWLGKYKTSNAGSVYKFNREKHTTTEEMQKGEQLIIGQDFNIGGCCSVVYVRRGDNMLAVDEFVSKDTFAVRDTIKSRYKGYRVKVIPDASGRASSTNANKSDIEILRDAGIEVEAPKVNPRIEDRINTTNAMYMEGNLFINTNKCPNFTKAQIKHQYNDTNGKPEKFAGAATIDDWNDAGTYPLHRLFGFGKPKVEGIEMTFA
jgi:PBSX family phage terminase large subunit